MRRPLSPICIVLSLGFAFAAFSAPLGTSFTYQGQLRRSGAPYTGTCTFDFRLWDAASGGLQIGGTYSIPGVQVVNGLFTVTIDFGEGPPGGPSVTQIFKGESRWLATSVQCSGDAGFTLLDPRQPITATPYALGLRPGASVVDSSASTSTPALFVQSLSTNTSALAANGLIGIYGSSANHQGVGVRGFASEFGSYGVDGYSSGQDGIGVRGTAFGATSAGVFGQNNSGQGIGVWGNSIGSGDAIFAQNTSTGLAGRFIGPVAVANSRSNGIGIDSSAFVGVQGKTTSPGGTGVYGEGLLQNSAGVYATNRDSAAIWGRSTGAGSAVFGENLGTGFAGRFVGPVHVQGALSKASGSFRIDHPLDPANKFLSHSFVESPDMMNIYNGNVTTDANGSATIMLPDYFAALNRDCRYQLTVVGQFAQAIVSREIAGNSFEIRTDKPGVKVSWQVTGVRQDAYAKAHPIVVEELKPAEQKGLYLFPAGYGAGEEKSIGSLSRPATSPEPVSQGSELP